MTVCLKGKCLSLIGLIGLASSFPILITLTRPLKLEARSIQLDRLLQQRPKLSMVEDNRSELTPENENDAVLVEGVIGEDLPKQVLDEIEGGQPSEWNVLKQLLGINVFTYILATAIVFFLSMNLVFGPGWLGSAIGVKGTGSFSEVSTSLPDTVDLSKPDFLL